MEQDVKNMLAIRMDEVKSLRDVAVETIREAIVTGYLKPGDHLKERDLSAQMGISTTPIKEALRILGHEGLVETVPRKGTYVSRMAESSIEEILMLRARLEGLCTRLAATKIRADTLRDLEQIVNNMDRLYQQKDADRLMVENSAFHMKVREAADNPLLLKMTMNISAYDEAFRKRALAYNVEKEKGVREHREIFDAIRQGDGELAEKRMISHIMRTAQAVLGENHEET